MAYVITYAHDDLSWCLVHILVFAQCCLVGFKDKSEAEAESKEWTENVLSI